MEGAGFAGFSASSGVAIADKAGFAEDALFYIAKHPFVGLGDADAKRGGERCTKHPSIGVVATGGSRTALLITERGGVFVACGDTLESKGAFESSGGGGIVGTAFADLAFGGLASVAFVDFAVTVVVFSVAALGFGECGSKAIAIPSTVETKVEATGTKANILRSSGAVIAGFAQWVGRGGDIVGLSVTIVVLSVAIFNGRDRGVVADTAPFGILAKFFSVDAVSAFAGAAWPVVTVAALAGGTSGTGSTVVDLAVAVVVLAVAKLRVWSDFAFAFFAP